MLSCPACGAQYNVALAAIPAQGRRVKCTACAYSWQAFAPEIKPEINPPIQAVTPPEAPSEAVFTAPMAEGEDNSFTPQPELAPETDQQSAALLAKALSRQGLSIDSGVKTGSMGHILRIAVVLLLTVAVLFGAGLLVLRQVAPNMPMLQPALAVLGMPSPVLGAGLAFENITVQRNADSNKLEVSGQLRNKTAANLPVPSLQMAVFANVGDVVPLKTWVVLPKMPQLAANVVAQLNYQLPDAPKDAAHIKLTFVE
jgi:predicted Zn finger-like uncharacterized protein